MFRYPGVSGLDIVRIPEEQAPYMSDSYLESSCSDPLPSELERSKLTAQSNKMIG